MARVAQVIDLEGGGASIRIDFPPPVYKVLVQLAEDLGIPPLSAARMMLNEIAYHFGDGDAMFLSTSFQRALKTVRDKNYGVLDAATAATIDLSKLHTSTRTKSGFVGVYANGKGFRAMAKQGPNTSGLKSIGTFPTAEEAAWRRFIYYKSNGLAYGELEVEMERWRDGTMGDRFKGTDEELIAEIKKHVQYTGKYEEIFGPSGVNEPRLQAKADAITPQAMPSKSASSDKVPSPIVANGIDPSAVDSIFGDDE